MPEGCSGGVHESCVGPPWGVQGLPVEQPIFVIANGFSDDKEDVCLF